MPFSKRIKKHLRFNKYYYITIINKDFYNRKRLYDYFLYNNKIKCLYKYKRHTYFHNK